MSWLNEATSVEGPLNHLMWEGGYERLSDAEFRSLRSASQPDSPASSTVLVPVAVKALMRLNGDSFSSESDAERWLRSEISLVEQASSLTGKQHQVRELLLGRRQKLVGDDHRDIALFDYDDVSNNVFHWVKQVTFKEVIFDAVGYVNGIPFFLVEYKSGKKSQDASKAADDIDAYVKRYPDFAAWVHLGIGADTKDLLLRYQSPGDVGWSMWRNCTQEHLSGLERTVAVQKDMGELTNPFSALDHYRNFSLVIQKGGGEGYRIVPRYYQYDVITGTLDSYARGERGGLIAHGPGSGKSYSMVCTAVRFLEKYPHLRVALAIDRSELQSQILDDIKRMLALFRPGLYSEDSITVIESRKQLKEYMRSGKPGIAVLMMQKVDVSSVVKSHDEGKDQVFLMDEVHRTQDGSLGYALRNANPKAAFYGYTGSPSDATVSLFSHDNRANFLGVLPRTDALLVGCIVDTEYADKEGRVLIDEGINKQLEEAAKSMGLSRAEFLEVTSDKQLLSHARKLISSPEYQLEVTKDLTEELKPIVKQGMAGILFVQSRKEASDIQDCIQKYWKTHKDTATWKSRVLITTGTSDKGTDLSKHAMTAKQQTAYLEEFATHNNENVLAIVVGKLGTGYNNPRVGIVFINKFLGPVEYLQNFSRAVRRYSAKDVHGNVKDVKEKARIVDYANGKSVYEEALSIAEYDPTRYKGYTLDIDAAISEYESLLAATLESAGGISAKEDVQNGLSVESIAEKIDQHITGDSITKFKEDVSNLSRMYRALVIGRKPHDNADLRMLQEIADNNGFLSTNPLGKRRRKKINEMVQRIVLENTSLIQVGERQGDTGFVASTSAPEDLFSLHVTPVSASLDERAQKDATHDASTPLKVSIRERLLNSDFKWLKFLDDASARKSDTEVIVWALYQAVSRFEGNGSLLPDAQEDIFVEIVAQEAAKRGDEDSDNHITEMARCFVDKVVSTLQPGWAQAGPDSRLYISVLKNIRSSWKTCGDEDSAIIWKELEQRSGYMIDQNFRKYFSLYYPMH